MHIYGNVEQCVNWSTTKIELCIGIIDTKNYVLCIVHISEPKEKSVQNWWNMECKHTEYPFLSYWIDSVRSKAINTVSYGK